MSKALVVILIIVPILGAGVALFSGEFLFQGSEDKQRIAQLEEEVKKLRAMFDKPDEGFLGIPITGNVEAGQASLFPFGEKIEKLESRVALVEKKLEQERNKPQASPLAKNDDPTLSGKQSEKKAMPKEPRVLPYDEKSILETLSQTDRNHIKSAIRAVIKEEQTNQKINEYESQRESRKRDIIKNIELVAKKIDLSDSQTQTILSMLEDTYTQMDRVIEDARYENKPELLDKARRELMIEFQTRAGEILDPEQREKLKAYREEQQRANQQKK